MSADAIEDLERRYPAPVQASPEGPDEALRGEIDLYHLIEAALMAPDVPANPADLAERITDAVLPLLTAERERLAQAVESLHASDITAQGRKRLRATLSATDPGSTR